jgi:tRNA-dihydrouridine synthase
LRLSLACGHAHGARPAFPFSAVAAEVPLDYSPDGRVLSESPFRRLCRAHGADVVVTEFLSAEGIRRENEATISKLRFGPDERPIGVQIFGATRRRWPTPRRFVTDVFRPEFVDINFGCPVKKVVKRNGGSGCLKDMALVDAIIRAVARATHLRSRSRRAAAGARRPATRWGIALRMQDAGARAFTLHARTRTQMYTGHARWEEIAAVVDALDVPVIGNGDVKTPTTWCACSA